MYQGIFDTDFDKYTEDAIGLFTTLGVNTVFENLEGFPEDWKTNAPAFIKFVRDHQRPSFLEYGEYPFVSAEEIKKALRLKAALLADARPDAVTGAGKPHARVRRYPAHPADARAGAHRAVRVPQSSGTPAAGTRVAGAHPRHGAIGPGGARDGRYPEPLGEYRLHLERPSYPRTGRGVAGDVPRGVQTGHGGPAPRCSATPVPIIRTTGWAAWRAPTCTRSSSCSRGMRPSVNDAGGCTSGVIAERRGRRGAVHARPRGDAAVRLRARSLRVPRPHVPAGHRGLGRSSRRPARVPRSRRASSSWDIPTRKAHRSRLPQPEILSRNGSFLAYRRLEEHVGAFREFLKQNGTTPEEQELVAAKLMGRWRSGAPLVLAPERDDPAIAADPQRNNDFNYAKRIRTDTRCRSARTSGG